MEPTKYKCSRQIIHESTWPLCREIQGRCVWTVVNIIRTLGWHKLIEFGWLYGKWHTLVLSKCENNSSEDDIFFFLLLLFVIYSTGLFQWIHENLPCSMCLQGTNLDPFIKECIFFFFFFFKKWWHWYNLYCQK